MSNQRTAKLERKTTETQITGLLNIDGSGKATLSTEIPFFDHMLHLFAKHSGFDLELKVNGDLEVDHHHTIEDTGIVLGELILQSLGDKVAIHRYGSCYIPMDDSLARVVIDLSNRPYLDFNYPLQTPAAPNFSLALTEEFFRALSNHLRANIHACVLYGKEGHHVVEALFKALARSLKQACCTDDKMSGVPSTKELL